MSRIHQQLKQRRKDLGLTQEDMLLRVGMARQQYQRLETKGNPRLETLELVAKGLNMELLLIPQEKLRAVRLLLEDKPDEAIPISDDPWKNLLEDEG